MFWSRTCQPNHMEGTTILFDKELRRAVEAIAVGGDPFFRDLEWMVTSLPIRVGRLSLYSEVEVASYTFMASRS